MKYALKVIVHGGRELRRKTISIINLRLHRSLILEV